LVVEELKSPCGGELLKRYIYADQLKPWFDVFQREQIHLVCLESFTKDPQAHYNQLVEYLGLPPHTLQTFQVHNSNPYRPMDADLRERLQAFYAPHNRRLREETGLVLPWAD
jgi:hypothetical protein